jgi:hypothetical protein
VRVIDQLHARYVPRTYPYFDTLDLIHRHLLPRTYVEIGVSTGRSMALALPGTRCVGVDPDPKPSFPFVGHTRIVSLTSDEFFLRGDLDELLGHLPLDLAFIDGMHHFEFALRDFINLERAAHRSTTVLIHDCLPVDEVTAARDRTTDFWSGDIWRLIVLLKEWRPDLAVAVADSGPTGVGIIGHLDPDSTVLADHYEEIVDHFLAMPYEALDDGSKATMLNQVPGTWPAIAARLPARPFRRSSPTALIALRALRAAAQVRRQARHPGGPTPLSGMPA